jgi:uncharacterized cupredoxin-like copper-binding protein
MSFQLQHGTMLLRYAGISFISGAVNHGFFSEERSLWTAAIGMVLFVMGAVMEHRQTPDRPQDAHGLMRTLVLGSLLSIGLGFFTGGLQHFPDSPARSAWVVPLGFAVSVFALAWSSTTAWQRAATVYVLVLGSLVSAGSWGAWQWLEKHPEWAATGHSHEAESAPSMTAQVVSRSVEVRLDDHMRFTPSTIDVAVRETVRFVVHNAGRTAHEMVLGSDEDIRAHAQAMQKGSTQGENHEATHSHASGAAITVPAGQTGELVVSFPRAQSLQMACLIPGHYEAGMRGRIQVGTAPASTAASPISAPAVHDHSTHKH